MAPRRVAISSPIPRRACASSNAATIVVARTASGDTGIMPGHTPVLSVLESGPVTIRTTDGGTVT